jgi:hypothetical protein
MDDPFSLKISLPQIAKYWTIFSLQNCMKLLVYVSRKFSFWFSVLRLKKFGKYCYIYTAVIIIKRVSTFVNKVKNPYVIMILKYSNSNYIVPKYWVQEKGVMSNLLTFELAKVPGHKSDSKICF